MCVVSLSGRNIEDSSLAGLLRDAPVRSVLLLEDVDAVFPQRGRRDGDDKYDEEKESASRVSFSALLNAIDGVVAQEGRLLLMTTNHIERLDPALIRPGRCDVRIEVGLASAAQLAAMFLRFFPGREAEASEFAGRLPAGELSLAQIQGHLVAHRGSAEAAVETSSSLLLLLLPASGGGAPVSPPPGAPDASGAPVSRRVAPDASGGGALEVGGGA